MKSPPRELDETALDPASGSRPRRPSPEAPRRHVIAGRYELLAPLGSGGMGTVFRAHDRELDEEVALKLIHLDLAAAPASQERFRREVKLARRITHRNVARTFEFGEDEGSFFLTMELVEGASLAVILGRDGRLSPARALPIALGICEALAAAHAAGIVHRDIKPDNVLVEAATGRVVVTDFGIAAPVGDAGSQIAGTPAYMAPEQVEGREPGPATDLYALGVLLYEALTGELPWQADGVLASLIMRLGGEAPDPRRLAPELPAPLAALIRRCMSAAIEARPSVSAVATELRAVLAGLGVATPPPSSIAAPANPGPPAPRSVAVLALRADPRIDAYIAEALADDLVDALSGLHGLRVRARRPEERGDPQAIGRAIDVSLLVDGSLRWAGEGALQVALRLIDVNSGFVTWAGRFEVASAGILEVPSAATRAIAAALALEDDAPVRAVPVDPAVIDLYLRARHHYNNFVPEAQSEALRLLEEAHARDPENALVASALSMTAVRLSFMGLVSQPALIERAQAAALGALARAPHLGEPHVALGHLSLRAGDPTAAARHARAAIARGPSLADAHELLGRLLLEAGRVVDAERRLGAALELDPRLSVARWERIRLAALDGAWDRFDRLVSECSEAERERRGRLSMHVRFAGWRQDRAILGALEVELQTRDDLPADFRRHLLAALGVYLRREPAGSVLGHLESLLGDGLVSARTLQWVLQQAAELAAFAGLRDGALEMLERCDDAGVFDLLWLERCPVFGELREEPRYERVRRSVQARADAIVDAIWG
ncbi:MAG: protein kinase [Myxococcales bacterium]|nr:protein kinase [Myxococcales bacterium]MCB9704110.1 protein kinase [Myxococcales bacterium]